MNPLITASLVYDGGDTVTIPPQMGSPRSDQMLGTAAEQLSELAGRVCYDSLGVGRPSFTVGEKQGYHDHIRAVNHGSVIEHPNFTVEIPLQKQNQQGRRRVFCMATMNRPGVMTFHSKRSIRITLNLRCVREWLAWETELYGRVTPLARQMCWTLSSLANKIAPNIIPDQLEDEPYIFEELLKAKIVAPKFDHEYWISLYLSGSRGFSHEQVRHGDFTAISQRSSRFCDENESDWVEHPLTTAYIAEAGQMKSRWTACGVHHVINECRDFYRELVDHLEPWLVARGVDKATARKQARGAARGYLGNGLHTEMIFSANVAQWKRMLRQRASVFADAEIREVYASVLPALKSSRYGDSFANWEQRPSPDGIGVVAVELQPEPALT